MENRKNIDKQKSIKSEQSDSVFSKKEPKNKTLKLSEQWYKSLLESFNRFKRGLAYKQ